MDGAKRVWFWIGACLVAALGIGLAVYHTIKGDKRAAALARADALEQNARDDIARKRTLLTKLKRDATKNAAKIGKVESGLKKKKKTLQKKFESQGLAEDEILERFKRVRL